MNVAVDDGLGQRGVQGFIQRQPDRIELSLELRDLAAILRRSAEFGHLAHVDGQQVWVILTEHAPFARGEAIAQDRMKPCQESADFEGSTRIYSRAFLPLEPREHLKDMVPYANPTGAIELDLGPRTGRPLSASRRRDSWSKRIIRSAANSAGRMRTTNRP